MYSYHFIILDLPEDKQELCEALLKESDHCYLISDNDTTDTKIF